MTWLIRLQNKDPCDILKKKKKNTHIGGRPRKSPKSSSFFIPDYFQINLCFCVYYSGLCVFTCAGKPNDILTGGSSFQRQKTIIILDFSNGVGSREISLSTIATAAIAKIQLYYKIYAHFEIP